MIIRRRLFRRLALAAGLAGSLLIRAQNSVQPAGWQTIFTDDFESGSLDNWDIGNGDPGASWAIAKDGANSVLSGQGHIFAYLDTTGWTDYRFKSRVKLLQGSINLNFRTSNCIRYFINFDANAVSLNRTSPCNTHTSLVGTSGSYGRGQWHVVEIIGVGANVKVYVDGALKIDYTDADPVLFGRPALESVQDTQVYIDDVEISGPPVLALPGKLTWTKVGGPIGGLGYDVKMRLDNPDMMFVTDTFSGVNISVNGGHTWSASNQGIIARTGSSGDAVPVFSLTIDGRNPDFIWAGTQNLRGIYRSTDGGKTWVARSSGVQEATGISFRGFTVDPNDSNTVYAAAEISSSTWAGTSIKGREFDLTKGVVYRTRDGGQSWTPIWRGDNLARYVWIDPRDTKVIYVSTGIFDREAANSDLLHGRPGGVGILRSKDGGQTWQQLGAANGLNNLYVGTLFLHPRNPDILLAGAGMNGFYEGAGIYLSTDQGEHWQRGVFTEKNSPTDVEITSVEFAISDPQIAYAANDNRFYRSEDGGRTWKTQSGGPPNEHFGPPGIFTGFPIDIQVDPRNPDRVFVNNYGGGNFLSEDGGHTWQVASRGYTGAQLHRVVVDPGDAGNLYTIGRSGPFRSLDYGENWAGLANAPANFTEWYGIALDPSNSATVLISTEFGGTLLRSSDGGGHWQLVFVNPKVPSDNPRERHGFKALAFAPSNSRTVYAGMCRSRNDIDAGRKDPSFGAYKSTDGGLTWKESNDATSSSQNIHVLLVDPHDENLVYAATLTSGILKSRDGGRSWQPTNRGLSVLDIRALVLSPDNPAVLYAGTEGGGLYKSTDGGSSWQVSGIGMDPQAGIRDIIIDPTNPSILYAGDLQTGVYRSEDGGKLWVAINKGLSTRAVTSLGISADGGTLYAATVGEGVFRLDLKARPGSPVQAVSAASFVPDGPLAPESIASAFGQGFAAGTQSAAGAPLPTTIAGTSLSVTDAAGGELPAPLLFVSPAQINFLVPAGLVAGPATIRVFRDGGVAARGAVDIEPVAPAIFTANADGKGAPAALTLHVAADGTRTYDNAFRCGAATGSCVASPIDLGPETDQVFLLLYGTGIRGDPGLAHTSVQIGGQAAAVLGGGAQGQYAGLDQVNVRLPRTLAGRGDVDVVLTSGGRRANTVGIKIR